MVCPVISSSLFAWYSNVSMHFVQDHLIPSHMKSLETSRCCLLKKRGGRAERIRYGACQVCFSLQEHAFQFILLETIRFSWESVNDSTSAYLEVWKWWLSLCVLRCTRNVSHVWKITKSLEKTMVLKTAFDCKMRDTAFYQFRWKKSQNSSCQLVVVGSFRRNLFSTQVFF